MTENDPLEQKNITIVDSFEQFFDNEEFGQLAKILDDVTKEYKAKNITLIEFIEITDDLIQAQDIATLTDDIDRQKTLFDVFEKVKMVVSLAIGAAT